MTPHGVVGGESVQPGGAQGEGVGMTEGSAENGGGGQGTGEDERQDEGHWQAGWGAMPAPPAPTCS